MPEQPTPDELVDRYLTHLRVERGASPNTLRAYSADLARYLEWARRTGMDPIALTHRQMRLYLAELDRAGYARRTVARRLSAVRSLFAYLVAKEIAPSDPSSVLATPKAPARLPTIVPADALAPLLDAPDPSTPSGLRDRAILEALYATGARVSEISDLRLRDLDLSQGQITVMGKGSKERLVPLHPLAVSKFRDYLSEGRPRLGKGAATDAVFLSTRGRPLSADAIRRAGVLWTIDGLRENQKGAIGTTKRGIGPAYESKVGRRGVRMGDLLRPERLPALVARTLDEAAPLIRHLGGEVPTQAAILAELEGTAERLGRYIGDASRYVYQEIRKGRSVLFEGAQGALLDIDHGTYPFVTSSSTTAGGACAGVGIGPTEIDTVIGIAKAYTTRVGGGPFPTELLGDAGQRLREAGAEFGATTGRPRRCGWLDIPALRVAVRLNGMSGLALTKLDVLGGMGPIKLAVGYRVGKEERDELPLDADEIAAAQPVYEDFAGWDAVTREVRDVDDLPQGARKYLRRIEALLGIEIYLISVGPGRAETIVLKNPFR